MVDYLLILDSHLVNAIVRGSAMNNQIQLHWCYRAFSVMKVSENVPTYRIFVELIGELSCDAGVENKPFAFA